nr:DUF6686 family protein [Allomuricauda sp.]
MCYRTKTLAKNEEGQLLYCNECNCYHLYFNNLYLEFTKREFNAFKRYVSEIDVDLWESCPNRTSLKRRIPIPTLQTNLVLTFCQQELQSLKNLIFEETSKPNTPISAMEIDYIHILN